MDLIPLVATGKRVHHKVDTEPPCHFALSRGNVIRAIFQREAFF